MTTPMIHAINQTNWTQYGLADIWDMVKREDGVSTTDHAKAWSVMYELCDGQAARLRGAAAQLAQHWPPDRSPAAELFIGRLHQMAEVFTDAAAAAAQNSGAVQNLTTGLLETRGRVKDLREAWRHLEGQEAKRIVQARKLMHSTFPIPVNLPDQQLLAASNIEPLKMLVDLNGAPDVPTDWRHRLDQRARDVMVVSDREINETRSLVQRAPVIPGSLEPVVSWPPPPGPGPGPGSGPHEPSRSGGMTGIGAFDAPKPVFNPPVPAPGRSPWLDSDPAADPLLSGGAGNPLPSASNPVVPMPSAAAQPLPPMSPWGGDARGLAFVPGGIIGVPPSAAASNHITGLGRPVTGGGTASQIAAREQAMLAKSSNTPFVAPPGGLIGGRPTGAGSGPSRPATGRRRRRNDPDDGWAVAEGVPPVLEPSPDPDTHGPGPGVFGIDR